MAKILLAEDEEALAVFVARALTQAGHTVERVPDGLAATTALVSQRFALLVSDIVMPGLDGIALALKATKDHPAMKILLMSGYAEERQRAHNLDAIANRVIAKPFTLAEICEAVEKTLAE